MDNTKKILVIEQKIKNSYHKTNEYVEQFLNHKKNTGYEIYFLEDYFGNAYKLLSGDINGNESISSENVNELINFEKFEYIIYVPADIQDISGALVFYSTDINKEQFYKKLSKINIIVAENAPNDLIFDEYTTQDEHIQNTDYSIQNDHKDLGSAESKVYENYTANIMDETKGVSREIKNKATIAKKGFIEKFLIIFPWFVMLLMSILRYGNIALVPFVISLAYIIIHKLFFKMKDRSIEFISMVFLFFAWVVNFIYPSWIVSIGLALSIMGIVLFTILNSINFNEE